MNKLSSFLDSPEVRKRDRIISRVQRAFNSPIWSRNRAIEILCDWMTTEDLKRMAETVAKRYKDYPPVEPDPPVTMDLLAQSRMERAKTGVFSLVEAYTKPSTLTGSFFTRYEPSDLIPGHDSHLGHSWNRVNDKLIVCRLCSTVRNGRNKICIGSSYGGPKRRRA